MGASRRYFREQFRADKVTLRHDSNSDFYLSCWQAGRSPVPLLCFRLVIFLGCLSILIASLTLMGVELGFGYWAIYMTHWGVAMIAVTSGLAFVVSLMATINPSMDSDDLPWYVQLYWVAYCITLPAAFFITVFYYTLLANAEIEFAVDPVLDLFIHGMNSVMMVCLLVSSQHPVHLLQFLYPFIFTIIYLIFSIIYYYSGGTDPSGNGFIYPMLDWTYPGIASVVVVGSAVFLLIMHILVMALTALRDYLSRRLVTKISSLHLAY